jgi:hypothetical protein
MIHAHASVIIVSVAISVIVSLSFDALIDMAVDRFRKFRAKTRRTEDVWARHNEAMERIYKSLK